VNANVFDPLFLHPADEPALKTTGLPDAPPDAEAV
jgi:hypothetical protein